MKPKEGEGINDFAIRAGYSGSQELMSKHPDLIFRDAETGYPFVDFMTDYPVANPSTGGGDIDQYIKMVDQDYEANGNIFTFGARDLAKRESTDASRENKEIKGLFGTVMNPNQQTTVPKLMEDQAIIEEEPAIDSEPELVDISDDSGDDSKKIWKQGMTSEQFNALFNNSVDRNVLNPAAKKALQDAIKIAEGEYKFWTEEHNAEIDLDKLTEAVDKKINAYTEKLDLIANEEAPPPFEGSTTRQVLAVVGAALGAAAASFSGSPNWALQILDKALDREQAQFIKKQEFKMLSAREQRMILVEQRGEMIQYALSKTKQAIAARQGATQSLGALKSIEAQMIQGAQQNLDVLAVNEVKNFYAFVAQMQATHGKRHGKYYGRIGTIIGTKSKEQLNLLNKELSELARGVISIEELSARAIDAIDKLENKGLLETFLQSGMLKAGTEGKLFKQVSASATTIFLDYKNKIAKVGQAMSEAEQKLVEKVIPSTTLSQITLGGLKSALNELNELMALRVLAYQKADGILPGPGDLNYEYFHQQRQKPNTEGLGLEKVAD